jgi:SAM-dependent methyltransferase
MDWQAQYESGETPWDEGAPHPALLDFIAGAGDFQGRILVPGSGLGHEVRAVSTAQNQVVGLDIAPAAVSRAQGFPKTGREEYIVANLFNLDPEMRYSFDWVIEHTCFCAIDPSMRPAYAAAVAGALKPGGHLFAIFYLNPGVDRQPPFGVAVPGLDRLFSPFFALVREWVPERTFEDRKSRELVRVLRRL